MEQKLWHKVTRTWYIKAKGEQDAIAKTNNQNYAELSIGIEPTDPSERRYLLTYDEKRKDKR